MPAGRRREIRDLHRERENAELLREWLRDFRAGGRARNTILNYGPAVQDFLDFI